MPRQASRKNRQRLTARAVASLLLEPLKWSVVFMPLTLVYYFVVIPVLLIAGLVALVVMVARAVSRHRNPPGQTWVPGPAEMG